MGLGTRVRRISWLFFLLIWLPLGFVVYTAAMGGDEDTIALAMVPVFIFCVLFAILFAGSSAIVAREKEKIQKQGIPAKAMVISLTDTSTTVNDQPLMKIELEVQPPYDSRFVTTIECVVPLPALMQLERGSVVDIFYLEDTKEVALADL